MRRHLLPQDVPEWPRRRRTTNTRPLGHILAAVALVALGGCGNASTAASVPSTPAPSASPAPSVADVPPGPAGGVPNLSGDPTDLTVATQAGPGTDPAPTALLTDDVVRGTGTAATATDTVQVRYTGTLWADGTLFDSSWSDGDEPVTFPLSAVVPGFAEGIVGMAPGGRRVIVMPPDLAYGEDGTGPIPPAATLVFVVDLVEITPGG